MASRCNGRKSEKPQTRWSASTRRASARLVAAKPDPSPPGDGGSASRVLALDVFIDQTLELRRELVVRPAQGGDMLPVDEDGTAGFFAGAGQADADARRLRLA